MAHSLRVLVDRERRKGMGILYRRMDELDRPARKAHHDHDHDRMVGAGNHRIIIHRYTTRTISVGRQQ